MHLGAHRIPSEPGGEERNSNSPAANRTQSVQFQAHYVTSNTLLIGVESLYLENVKKLTAPITPTAVALLV
jgi:hypothetical protein